MAMGFQWRALAVMGLALLLSACQGPDFFYHDPPVIGETVRFRSRIVRQDGFGGVDILWIIDNSQSMENHQNAVISNTSLFISRFKPGIRWKMGLISSDSGDDPYVGFAPGDELNDQTPTSDRIFMAAVGRLGLRGSGYEKAFEPMLGAFSRYPDFLSQRSALAVIIVTDAPEQSESDALNRVLDRLRQVKGGLASTFVYGVFSAIDLSGCHTAAGETEWTVAGSSYEKFIKATQGKVYNLCALDFGSSLANLADDLFSRVTQPRINLPKRPLASTLSVTYRGARLPGGLVSQGGVWVYDYSSNSVVFHSLDFARGDLEEVDIQFTEDVGTKAS